MHIQCPKCKITYNVSDNLINSSASTFRCSRCKHTFVLEMRRENKPAKRPVPSPAKQLSENEENRELSFSFAQPQSEPPDKHPEAENSHTQPSRVRDAKLEMVKEGNAVVDEKETRWSLPLPQPNEAQSTHSSAGKAPAHPLASQSEPEFEKNWWAPPKRVDEKQLAIQFSTAPFLGLFLGLLVFYSFLVLNYTSRPAELEKFLRLIPGMEWAVFRNNHLKDRIEVQSVIQRVQFIRGNREVLTISGSVVNRNAVSVREVRLEGYLFNGEGKEIARQQISVGNPISTNLIGAVEARDISILQEIGPQKRFTILPDESAPFVIVFLKPAKEIKSFAYRVLSAEEVN
jgi:predicted Zn finger-like uncharacterized protein